MKLAIHLPVVHRLRMRGTMAPLLHKSSSRATQLSTGTVLPFILPLLTSFSQTSSNHVHKQMRYHRYKFFLYPNSLLRAEPYLLIFSEPFIIVTFLFILLLRYVPQQAPWCFQSRSMPSNTITQNNTIQYLYLHLHFSYSVFILQENVTLHNGR